MSDRECTWCKYLKVLYTQDIAAQLREYIAHIPEEQKCSEDVYEGRLSHCNGCSQATNGVCGVCGCYVAARAAKAQLHCPLPGASKL